MTFGWSATCDAPGCSKTEQAADTVGADAAVKYLADLGWRVAPFTKESLCPTHAKAVEQP